MNKLWLLLLLVIPYQSIHAQEAKHAPTVALCQADQRLWGSKLEQAPIPSGVKDVSFMELLNWYTEMKDCMNVDPDHRTDYLATLGLVETTQYTRLVNFLDRHHLTWDQFWPRTNKAKGAELAACQTTAGCACTRKIARGQRRRFLRMDIVPLRRGGLVEGFLRGET